MHKKGKMRAFKHLLSRKERRHLQLLCSNNQTAGCASLLFSLSCCACRITVNIFTMSYCEVFQSSSVCLSLTSFLLRTVIDYLRLPTLSARCRSYRRFHKTSFPLLVRFQSILDETIQVNSPNNRFVDTSERSLVKGMVPTKDQSERSLRKPQSQIYRSSQGEKLVELGTWMKSFSCSPCKKDLVVG